MSTLEQTQPAGHRSRERLGIVLTALGTLVAVAVVVVFLTLPGSSQTTASHASRATQSTAANAPLIQYRGTGARPPAAVHTPPVRRANPYMLVGPTTPPFMRHEQSPGTVH